MTKGSCKRRPVLWIILVVASSLSTFPNPRLLAVLQLPPEQGGNRALTTTTTTTTKNATTHDLDIAAAIASASSSWSDSFRQTVSRTTSAVWEEEEAESWSTEQEQQEQQPPEPTGHALHLPECGMKWEDYLAQLPRPSDDNDAAASSSLEWTVHDFDMTGYATTHKKIEPQTITDNSKDKSSGSLSSWQREPPRVRPIVWTVAGGPEYAQAAPMMLEHLAALGLAPVLVIALDEPTALQVCANNLSAVLWSAPAASYARVADAKFQVAASLADKGYYGFFIELDVFCRFNPLPLFWNYLHHQSTTKPLEHPHHDLVNMGHTIANHRTNIGAYLASPRMGPWFWSLSRVLAPSRDQPDFINHMNGTQRFFDQQVYVECSPSKREYPTEYQAYYLVNDTLREHNLLDQHCRQHQNFSYAMLPHHLMSAHGAPMVSDSTYCIHPLAGAPFSSFAFKRFKAQFLGFDPRPIRPDEKFLKTYSGHLEYNECRDHALLPPAENKGLLTPAQLRQHIQPLVTVLVDLARRTNRTLVLPQYIWSKDALAFPVHAVLNLHSLDSILVSKWRFATSEWAHRMEPHTSVVVAGESYSETVTRVVAAHEANPTAPVLAIEKFCRQLNSRFHAEPQFPGEEDLRDKKLKWCPRALIEWTHIKGGWMNMCGS